MYATETQGRLDEELVEKVGYSLHQRCRSILMVTGGEQVDCPACNFEIVSNRGRWSRQNPVVCPVCDWSATYGEWRDSWRHRDLVGGNAVKVIQAYYMIYLKVITPEQRLLMIDQLLHAFHWSTRHQRLHAPAAKLLIQGDLEEVLAFMDELAGMEFKRKDLNLTKEEYQLTLDRVAESFGFIRDSRQKPDNNQ